MVYVTGDMHREEARLHDRRIKRLKKRDTLIILGDFGFVWDDSDWEKKIHKHLGKRRYNVCFLDGTNENHDLLNKYPLTVWSGGKVHRINNRLFHMCRGQIFDIDGYKIFTFGGGESPDREMRTEHKTWWREEMPARAELEEGVENLEELSCQVDFILTHEPPALIKRSIAARRSKPEQVSKLNCYLQEVNNNCTFKKWYFGSCHEDKIITPVHTAVYQEILPVEDLKKKKKRQGDSQGGN